MDLQKATGGAFGRLCAPTSGIVALWIEADYFSLIILNSYMNLLMNMWVAWGLWEKNLVDGLAAAGPDRP